MYLRLLCNRLNMEYLPAADLQNEIGWMGNDWAAGEAAALDVLEREGALFSAGEATGLVFAEFFVSMDLAAAAAIRMISWICKKMVHSMRSEDSKAEVFRQNMKNQNVF